MRVEVLVDIIKIQNCYEIQRRRNREQRRDRQRREVTCHIEEEETYLRKTNDKET